MPLILYLSANPGVWGNNIDKSCVLQALKAQEQGIPPVIIRLQPVDPDKSDNTTSDEFAAASVDGPSKASIRAKATLRF